jgi:aryl sulfotransferase
LFSGGAQSFVNKGTNKRWKDTLSKTDCDIYDARAVKELGADCATWLETGIMPGG